MLILINDAARIQHEEPITKCSTNTQKEAQVDIVGHKDQHKAVAEEKLEEVQ